LTETRPGLLSRLVVDFDHAIVTATRRGEQWLASDTHDFADREAFEAIATAWLRIAWDVKHQWTFTWAGRPIIQLPEDLVRVQEVIWHLEPDVILETGVAHGGSLMFYATICKALGHGEVIGVELPRSPELDHRDAIRAHPLSELITLVHGDSIDPQVVDQVHALIGEAESVLLLCDSAHSKEHVLRELEAYHDLVQPGGYAVVQDGFPMRLVAAHHGPRSESDWSWNNPLAAAEAFVFAHPEWRIEPPAPLFDESIGLGEGITHWTGGWLRRG